MTYLWWTALIKNYLFIYLGTSIDDKPKEANPEITVEKDQQLMAVLDRMILYLRVVHSFDFYSGVEYPNEDEMPHRCGIMHARGPVPLNRVTQNDGMRHGRTDLWFLPI